MNPQMQQYRQQYAPPQNRTPATARRPGECDPSTGVPYYPYIPPGGARSPYQGHQNGNIPMMPSSQDPFIAQKPQHPLLRSFQTPQLQQLSLQPQVESKEAQIQRVLATMAPEQRDAWLKKRRLDIIEAELERAPYLLRTGGMAQNPNQAAQQHQRHIYEQNLAQRNAAIEHQLAQRRARKPTDRNMPEGIEDLVYGEGVQQYKDLREVEKKLDYAMMRKRLDIQDTVNRNVKRQKTMRIWISNTCENQPWQRPALDENSFDFNSGADATYKVKVEGKLLDEPDDDIMDSDDDEDSEMKDTEESKEKRPQSKHKFTHYFKSLSVEFDKSRNPVNTNPNIDPAMQIEWKKNAQSMEIDCLEFTRKGDENLNITINLVRDEQLERYRLSQALAGTLDMEEADRAEVVMGIWEYVKAMGLQEDEERRLVRCDERLKAVCRA